MSVDVPSHIFDILTAISALRGYSVTELLSEIAEAFADLSEPQLGMVLRLARACKMRDASPWCEVIETVIQRIEIGSGGKMK